MLWLEDPPLFGLLPAVLALDSWMRLDAWRAVPVRSDPGYVQEMR